MFSLLGAVLAFLIAALKFLFTAKFGAGVAVGSLFVPSTALKSTFARGYAWVKAKFAKKPAA